MRSRTLVRRRWAMPLPLGYVPRANVNNLWESWIRFYRRIRWKNLWAKFWSYPELHRRVRPDQHALTRDEWQVKLPEPRCRQIF